MSDKSKNEVTVLSNANSLPAVPNALEQLKNELKAIKEVTETSYKTDGDVDAGFSNTIQNENKVENLVKMYGSVIARKNLYDQAQKELGNIEVPAFKIKGHSVESIKHDVLLKISVINYTDRKNELEALVKEGETFLTKEHLFEMYQQKVANAIKK